MCGCVEQGWSSIHCLPAVRKCVAWRERECVVVSGVDTRFPFLQSWLTPKSPTPKHRAGQHWGPASSHVRVAQVVGISFSLVASLITIIGINPILAVLLVPVAALYYFIQSFFRHTSRELQRLNNISKSPIFAHLSETLGLPPLLLLWPPHHRSILL